MTSNRPSGKPTPGKSNPLPPTSRRSARQQRLAGREANRALSRAGTRGSSEGISNLIVYTLGALIIGAIVIGAAYVVTRPSGPSANASPIPPAANIRTPSTIPQQGRVLGQSGAPVTIDVYEDFRCTFCFDFTVQTEPQVVTAFVATGKAKMVWHDLITIDQGGSGESHNAAAAAWCAADQNLFWPMHDWLFANQSPAEAAGFFTLDRLRAIAQAAGLDMTKYDSCMNSNVHQAEVAGENSAAPSGINGTPSIFVNGKQVGSNSQAVTYDLIASAINGALGISPSPSVGPSPSVTPAPSASAS